MLGLKRLCRLQALKTSLTAPPACAAAPLMVSALLHSSHAGLHSRIQTGIKHFAPQGLCTGCYFSLEPFLPMPLSCPFLVIPLLEVC